MIVNCILIYVAKKINMCSMLLPFSFISIKLFHELNHVAHCSARYASVSIDKVIYLDAVIVAE